MNFGTTCCEKRKITSGVGAGDPNRKNCLYCSNVKNYKQAQRREVRSELTRTIVKNVNGNTFTARFGVSAKIGGIIPFQYDVIPSCTYIFLKQSMMPVYAKPPAFVLLCICKRVFTKSSGCIMHTSTKPTSRTRLCCNKFWKYAEIFKFVRILPV